MTKQIIMAAVVAVALGVAGMASAQFGGLGNKLKNTATDAAKGAAAGAAMDVKTTCNCKSGKPDSSCTAMGTEIVGKIKSLEAADPIQASKTHYNCDIHDKDEKLATKCSEELRNLWVKMGGKRISYQSAAGDNTVSCRVRVSSMQ